jgi:FtsH-binding integral membrane protein
VAGIALVAFGFSYGLAAFALMFVATFRRWGRARDIRAISPAILTPLAVVLALLLGFLASRVWTNFDRANGYISEEAGALTHAMILAKALPPELEARLRQAVGEHLASLERDEWPAMRDRTARPARSPSALMGAIAALLAYTPGRAGETLAQQQTLVALERALDARRSRIMLSGAAIAPIQWLVIVVLMGLILVTIAIVHVDGGIAAGVAVFVFSSAMAVCLFVLLTYDRPLNGGGVFLQPISPQDVLPD